MIWLVRASSIIDGPKLDGLGHKPRELVSPGLLEGLVGLVVALLVVVSCGRDGTACAAGSDSQGPRWRCAPASLRLSSSRPRDPDAGVPWTHQRGVEATKHE
jgi:hypothetical protein